MEVEQSAFDGESGSPLIDATGRVVATCRYKINANIALYAPMALAFPLLTQIPMSEKVSSLDKKIRERAISFEMLVKSLQPNAIRNIELLSWAVYMSRSPRDYSGSRDYFSCPIRHAYWHRKLDVVANEYVDKYITFRDVNMGDIVQGEGKSGVQSELRAR